MLAHVLRSRFGFACLTPLAIAAAGAVSRGGDSPATSNGYAPTAKIMVTAFTEGQRCA